MAELIAFYSRADENYYSGVLRYVEIGNTAVAANLLQELTGADLFQIEQEPPYSKDYNSCINEAQEDQRTNARPKLKKIPNSIEQYDTIYLGYPNYWGTMPMAVFTFLESFDFTGKTIRPFCTHEGSGMGRSESDIKKLCPGAKVEQGMALQGSAVNQSKRKIESWL